VRCSLIRLSLPMRRLLDEPPIEPIRSYYSQLCVMLTGIASGGIEAIGSDTLLPAAFHMGRRDGYHVVVAHLAASATLREAADKCEQFGLGVAERAEVHPYGPDWSQGFAHATLDAASELALYAATATVPPIDRRRLEAARAAVRQATPVHALRTAYQGGMAAVQPPADW